MGPIHKGLKLFIMLRGVAIATGVLQLKQHTQELVLVRIVGFVQHRRVVLVLEVELTVVLILSFRLRDPRTKEVQNAKECCVRGGNDLSILGENSLHKGIVDDSPLNKAAHQPLGFPLG